MTKNLFVGGPWHGRLIEGVLTTGHTWRVPVPLSVSDLFGWYDIRDTTPRIVDYARQRLIIPSPADSRAIIEIWTCEDGRSPLLVGHAMATALGMSIVEER
jgi:hypothetical protein